MRKACFLSALLILSTLIFSGCVRRRMTVASNPPGATVYLDGKELGRTPFSTNFDYYGKREFRVVKDGYETKTVLLPVRAPWYQWPGIDFFSEVLLPGKLTDDKSYEFDLQPNQVVVRHELVGRAEDIRRNAHAEGVIRIGSGGSVTAVPSTIPDYDGGSLTSPYSGPVVPATPTYPQPGASPAPASAPTQPHSYVPPTF